MVIEWPQAITALVAIYGAVISTYNLIQQRKKERRNLKIDVSAEKCDKVEGINKYGEPIRKPDVPTRVFTILNIGQRAVMVDRFDLCIKNGECIEVPQVNLGYYGEGGIFQYHDDFLPLPYDLLPDRKYHLRIHDEDIAKVLHEKGYSTKLELIGRFIDQAGNSFKSPSFWLDLNEFLGQMQNEKLTS